MSVSTQINLARSLRPQQFAQLVGQDLVVKMLCNGLALGRLFPTYIFSGQRGCGKTTTARVFAAALNCTELDNLLAQKTLNIPCLRCVSCQMMQQGTHPDFIEIDAASNTGVDNVRQVLEMATYLPLQGRKKVYLIDEVHMLSKSAFNAFLKMLEEPPASAIFLLATTELHKVPDTVRSRCFQALFKPLAPVVLQGYLQEVCKKQKYKLEKGVLQLVATCSQGCIRDSLNLLEQLLLAVQGETDVSQAQVAQQMLGIVGGHELLQLAKLLLGKDIEALFSYVTQLNLETKRIELVWQDLAQLFVTLLHTKLGVAVEHVFEEAAFASLCEAFAVNALRQLLRFLWQQEEVLARTVQKELFFRYCLAEMWQLLNKASESLPAHEKPKSVPKAEVITERPGSRFNHASSPVANHASSVANPAPIAPKVEVTVELPAFWPELLQHPAVSADKLFWSILQQAAGFKVVEDTAQLSFRRLNQVMLRKLEDNGKVLLAALQKHEPTVKNTKFVETGEPLPTESRLAAKVERAVPASQGTQAAPGAQNFQKVTNKPAGSTKATIIDISDKEKWPKANQLKEMFGGRIEKVI